MINFLINRREWFRGRGSDNSRLKIPDHCLYCCLGLIARDLGVKGNDLEEAVTPLGLLLNVNYMDTLLVESGEQSTTKKQDYTSYFNYFLEEIGNECFFRTGTTRLNEVARKSMDINDHLIMNDLEREERLTEIFNTININPVFYN